VFVFKNGKFLMGQRKGSHGNGTWSLPGGWLEYQESFEEAARREVLEETGIKIKNIAFGGLTNNIFKEEDVHSLTVWLTSNWQSGDPQILEPDKFIDQRWIDFNSLPEPLFLPWQRFLESDFLKEIKDRLLVA